MLWRTHVSQPSACETFGARRRLRPASILGSPGPSKSTGHIVKRAVRCTRVPRTSVCVAFGARGLAATPLGLLPCTAGPPSEPSNDHTQSSTRTSAAKAAYYQDQHQSATAPPTVNKSHRCATPVNYAPSAGAPCIRSGLTAYGGKRGVGHLARDRAKSIPGLLVLTQCWLKRAGPMIILLLLLLPLLLPLLLLLSSLLLLLLVVVVLVVLGANRADDPEFKAVPWTPLGFLESAVGIRVLTLWK